MGVALTCDNVSSRVLIGLGSLASISIAAGDGGGAATVGLFLLQTNLFFPVFELVLSL